MMIEVENDGRRIRSTNYWSTENARRGFAYLSVNAGAFRLLVPPPLAGEVPGMVRGAEYVIVTRGTFHGRDALELLFEDHSDSPYALHIEARQADRLPAAGDEGRTDLAFLLYTPPLQLAAELPARYRRGGRLPDLSSWRESGSS